MTWALYSLKLAAAGMQVPALLSVQQGLRRCRFVDAGTAVELHLFIIP